MERLRKIYFAFLSLFFVMDIILILALLDASNIIDYGFSIESIMSLIGAVAFVIGIIFGLILLVKNNRELYNLRTVKIFLGLYYIMSPLGLALVPLIGYFFDNSSTDFFSLQVLLPITFLLLVIILIILNFLSKDEWSKGLKIFTIIYNIIIGSISAILIFITLVFSMHDGGIS